MISFLCLCLLIAFFYLLQVNCINLVLESIYVEDDKILGYLAYVDDLLMAVFLFECAVKVIAFGFVFAGPTAYIKNSWNQLDFLVICLGYVCLPIVIDRCSMFMFETVIHWTLWRMHSSPLLALCRLLSFSGQLSNFTFIRTLRVLRPLKAISGVAGADEEYLIAESYVQCPFVLREIKHSYTFLLSLLFILSVHL